MASRSAATRSVHPVRDAALISAALLLISILGLCSIYVTARHALIAAVQSELSQLAATLAAQIDGDLHRTIRTESQAGSREHLAALVPIARFLGSSRDIIYAYTAVLQGGEIRFILSGEYVRRDPEDRLPIDPIGHLYPGKDPQFIWALRHQQATVNPQPIRERSGRQYMSAFAPFYDSQHSFVGVVGVDMWTRDLDRRLRHLSQALQLSTLGVSCLALLVGAIVLRLRRAAAQNQLDRIQALVAAERHAQESEAANRAKSAFLAIMSHEIRTPLNGILGLLSLLRSTPLNEQQAEFVRTVQSASETQLALINDILDYSKIEAGKLDLEQASFDVRDCIEDALSLFAAVAYEKGVSLEYEAAPEVPTTLIGDRLRLRQILVNLVSNAVKFTAQGDVFVELHAEHQAEQVVLHCDVTDSGMGIPADRLDTLFQPYAQGDASTSRRFGGSGLGLAICKRLVEGMAGQITVKSTPGSGSVFSFTVRLGRWAEPASQPEVPGLPAAPVGQGLLLFQLRPVHCRLLMGLAEQAGLPSGSVETCADLASHLAKSGVYAALVVPASLAAAERDALLATVEALPAAQRPQIWALAALGAPVEWPPFVQVLRTPLRPRAILARLRQVSAPPPEQEPAACRAGASVPDPIRSPRPLPSPPASAPPPGGSHRAPPAAAPLRILVAEDTAINRQVMTFFLAKLGYQPRMVENGRQVLDVCRQEAIDVILMDVHMPELDGHQATHALRRQPNSPSRPWIIALTASTSADDVTAARAAGMNDFLTKPLTIGALAAALERAAEALQSAAQPGLAALKEKEEA